MPLQRYIKLGGRRKDEIYMENYTIFQINDNEN
jgi:hypothetical protein